MSECASCQGTGITAAYNKPCPACRGRNRSFTSGSGLPPRGRILTDPAEIKALRDEKRYADRDD